MRRILLTILLNAVALWLLVALLPGVDLATTSPGDGEGLNPVLAYVFIAVVFGLVNACVKPLVSVLSLPLTVLTLGLFTVVINAAMLWLTAWISSFTPVHFTIDAFFWTAIVAALLISAVSLLTGGLVRKERR